jgi:hypothetical protein
VDLLTGLSAPGLVTVFGVRRLKSTVVRRDDMSAGIECRVAFRRVLERREESVIEVERRIARLFRSAIWAACSAASFCAFSRAAADSVLAFSALVTAELLAPATLRFLGEFGALLDPDPDPKTSWSLRLVPAISEEANDFSCGWCFGFGPRTPRQERVPQRHS